jgi:hypothetical protein
MDNADIIQEIDEVLVNLIDEFGLTANQSIRLYKGIVEVLDDVAKAVTGGLEWPIQVIDQRYARWPTTVRVQDLTTGRSYDVPPMRPVTSYAIDLAEMVRRLRGGANGAGDQGGGAAGGMGPDVD